MDIKKALKDAYTSALDHYHMATAPISASKGNMGGMGAGKSKKEAEDALEEGDEIAKAK